MKMSTLLAVPMVALAACASTVSGDIGNASSPTGPMPASGIAAQSIADRFAADYLRLTLEAGTYEAEYVDAYYGPEQLRAAAVANPRPRDALIAAARVMIAEIDRTLATPAFAPQAPEAAVGQRRRLLALRGMLVAADTRLQMIGGTRFAFDAEAQGQFATTPVLNPLSHYDAILANLDSLIPGTGPLAARVDAFNDRYTIPPERLRPVFDAAIAECRRRTMLHIPLPAEESFTMEFVTNKPWSGYNYYQGNFRSLIQINTDLPIRISRAVDLGCHEGYPGHHVLNLMVEQNLVRSRGWREYEVNPLYSPTSVISEGSANYGIDLAFPGAEKLVFERDVLYPLAGLDPASADEYARVQAATEALSGARLTIAKLYLDGEIDRVRAVELTRRYLLLSPARAEQSIGFTDHYRSYVLNYGWGKDLVRAAIEAGSPDQATRWQRMQLILSEPTLPADLVAMAAGR